MALPSHCLIHEGRLARVETQQADMDFKLDEALGLLKVIHDDTVRLAAEKAFAQKIVGILWKVILIATPIGLWLFGGKWQALLDNFKAFGTLK